MILNGLFNTYGIYDTTLRSAQSIHYIFYFKLSNLEIKLKLSYLTMQLNTMESPSDSTSANIWSFISRSSPTVIQQEGKNQTAEDRPCVLEAIQTYDLR